MIAIDTNIIVRLLTKDDTKQYHICRKLFEAEEIYISDTVILETEWVLRFAYEFEPIEVGSAFRKLFGLPNVKLSNNYIIAQAINWHEQGLDFTDAFHLALSQSIPTLKTFDGEFIKKSKDLSKRAVQKP
ncbi:MAG: type II toxin-antitoxin system VapC family toxin [Candidatus Competibacteraceae bacterium]|nr:type II toxin-antitoxin system VapC family toxin [Candidatus Competibacteraceae bacterium]MBK7983245.1 type II toxin-antitoxin system VapC family toxin [Candidatus Competibacteraceae bacterium]MBK8898207.1 type II toxin-antitoxin system VapC family toxin [Candidatus Competibacteraceae bacterium]MBK8962014.1 type II toxin-antitoxin system VapC family toxin [Candidatus Competibacteraceae bacterium]MBK9951229.1 type II toxin-antitoxin system VapC family toxin [Candidatus Competibacteraceae bact